MMKCLLYLMVVLLTAGCAKTITVTPPNLNTTFNPDIPFSAPAQPNLVKLTTKDGKNSITKDNVTVEVDSVVSTDNESDYTVSVNDPSDPMKSYNFKLFPMMLKLKMTNNSNHIITLTKTIVKLEDRNQNDYPMMNTLAENKQKLSAQVQRAYKPFTSDFQKNGVEICKKKIKSIATSEEHARMAREIAQIRKEGNNVRTPDMQKGYYKTEYGIEELLKAYEPDNAAIRVCENADIYKKLGEISQKANDQLQDALYKISQIPDSMKNTITNGVYQPINVLPGRTEIIMVPFGPRKEDEEIGFLHVAIFDLPTVVDDAGNPIKRSHFNFELVAAQ